MKKIAYILPSEFRRLPVHLGALYALYDLLPEARPHLIVGCSAGAIAGAACLPWTEEAFEKTGSMIRDLRAGQIYSIPSSLEALAVLAASSSLVPFVNFNKIRSGKTKFLIPIIETGVILTLDAFLFNQFMKRKYLFSNEPLKKLLLNNLDFPAIFNSQIKLEMIAVDIETAEEVTFTNYKAEDKEPERFVNGILASAKLSGRFPPMVINGHQLGDAALLGNAPLHHAVEHGCDVAIVFLYTPLKEGRRPPNTFLGDVIRAAQVTEAELTRWQIENFILRKKLGEDLPELLVVETQEPLPEMNFREFNRDGLIYSMNLGYETIKSAMPSLERLLA